ncbi:MAG: FG-GAP-like repeat-containing protein [Acidobacteriota bacterium]|nr:FG-GAP-like repeat-containing protein [Acidobacteriota bacterium]
MRKTVNRLLFIKYGIVGTAAVVAVIGLSRFSIEHQKSSANASGPPASFTGAPLENNCTACHRGSALNGGGGNILITGMPANYLPGQQIPLTVTVNQPGGAVLYGFQLTTIDNQGRKAGTYTFPGGTPQQMQLVSGLVGGNERQYVEHTSNGTTPTSFVTKSWNFTWNAPAERIGKLSFYAAGNAADSDGSTSGDKIYTTDKATLSGSAIANFDFDVRSDVSVFRPSTGVWYALTSGEQGFQVVEYGQSGDKPAPGDYDGDGKTDNAVFRPSNGTWYIRKSSGGFQQTQFGISGDLPVPGDYDGDLKNDLAVFRPSNNTWYILTASNYIVRSFGEPTDKTAQGDYDGDAKTDIAVWRPSNGTWYVLPSRTNGYTVFTFGVDGDIPVQSDYDGDGKTDYAVFRPSNGTWYRLNATQGFVSIPFGQTGDKPAPADFDGDGKTDIAVFRNGTWYIQGTVGPSYSVIQFGETGDIPVPSGYIAE